MRDKVGDGKDVWMAALRVSPWRIPGLWNFILQVEGSVWMGGLIM